MKERFSLARKVVVAGALLSFGIGVQAFADQPPPDQYRERVPVQRDEPKERAEVRESGWGARLRPGVTNFFFADEDYEVMPALYADVYNKEWPLNFSVGIEGRHMFLGQDNAAGASDGLGNTPKITYIRIPFALEYVLPIYDQGKLFLGGGPDIINTANDLGDTAVGGHLGGRWQHDFVEHWGVAVEAGYAWGEVEDGDVKNVSLDGAYITPTVVYTF